MIAVIADDLTGAAELGGIGLRQGLTVEMSMRVEPSTKADLLVIAADSRGMKEAKAIKEMEKMTRQLAVLRPEWIYKKTDSVLRGHVIAEMEVQMEVLGLDRALLVSANPALGRTIKDGHYFLHGRAIHESSFALDPEFGITSSAILDMLRPRQLPVLVRKHSEGLAEKGITVGEVSDRDDLRSWAALATGPLLLAGASGFFTELLRTRRSVSGPVAEMVSEPGYPTLFISGTTFGKNRDIIRRISDEGGPVSYIDAGMSGEMDIQLECIINNLLDQGKAIVAIEGNAMEGAVEAARRLRVQMAKLVSRVLTEVELEELVIEGGATAYAILEQAGLRNFFPVEELAPGVIRMRAGKGTALHVTVKPGSYEWPEDLLRRLEN